MEELYRQHARTVYAFLLSLCGNKAVAEDLMQETFLQAYLSLDRYDGTCKVSVWLCQIGKHLWYQYLDKHKREQPLDLTTEQSSTAPGPEQQAIARSEFDDLMAILDTLPGQMRQVVHLRLFGDLSFREIGSLLGKSENWARVTYFRGKEKMMKGWNNDD